jgi:hypothetical protein
MTPRYSAKRQFGSWAAPLLAMLAALVLVHCQTVGLTLRPLEEQKADIRQDQIRLQTLSTQAFFETWGKPAYEHREHMQFYPVETGNYVPRFRVPLGETPPGWKTTIVSEPAHFLGYVDRGELLGFVNDRLVYREQMSANQLHAVANMWKRESLFKTRIESEMLSPQKP